MWCPICDKVELERKEEKNDSDEENREVEIKLEKPWAGWSSLSLKDERGEQFIGTLSYIDMVPWIFLNIFETYIDTSIQTAATFEEEGSEWTIVLSQDFTRIMWERETAGAVCLFITANELMEAVCKQIDENIDDWVKWDYFSEDDLNKFEKDKNKMKELIDKILKRIERG